MKRNAPFVFLFFLLLIVALIFSATQARRDEVAATPSPWLPPQITPDSIQPTLTPGWWDKIPTAIPFPTPTPRK